MKNRHKIGGSRIEGDPKVKRQTSHNQEEISEVEGRRNEKTFDANCRKGGSQKHGVRHRNW